MPSNGPALKPGTPNDPWAHHSAGMKCRSCLWYVEKVSPETPEGAVGRCRKRTPTMDGYPVVFENDWCGDHKLDETKLH